MSDAASPAAALTQQIERVEAELAFVEGRIQQVPKEIQRVCERIEEIGRRIADAKDEGESHLLLLRQTEAVLYKEKVLLRQEKAALHQERAKLRPGTNCYVYGMQSMKQHGGR
jgi:predicted  nucleic acid-binding Zn-ribbon protein